MRNRYFYRLFVTALFMTTVAMGCESDEEPAADDVDSGVSEDDQTKSTDDEEDTDDDDDDDDKDESEKESSDEDSTEDKTTDKASDEKKSDEEDDNDDDDDKQPDDEKEDDETSSDTDSGSDSEEKSPSDTPSDSETQENEKTETATDTDTPQDKEDSDSVAEVDSDTNATAELQELRSTLPYDTAPEIAAADYESFVANSNDFGFELFEQVVTDDANLFFSPVSMSTALAMAYGGAKENTASQMAEAMNITLTDEMFHKANNMLKQELASRNIAPHDVGDGEKEVQLSLVNAIWAQEDFTIKDTYLDLLSTNYDTGAYLLNFIADPESSRLIINDWVEDNTNDKIQDLLSEGTITTATRVVLTNALYFFGSWLKEFTPESTDENGTFHTLNGSEVTAPLMHMMDFFAYAEGDGYQLVNLPYDGNMLSMCVVLPAEGQFTAIRNSMNREWLDNALETNASSPLVILTLPKFSFTWGSTSFKEPLQALGMEEPFQNTANFTGIATNLFISDVIHQAFIAVDEYGTEAAAATAVVMDNSGDIEDPPEPETVTMTVDRPFLFFIRDRVSGVILFAGQVLNPTA